MSAALTPTPATTRFRFGQYEPLPPVAGLSSYLAAATDEFQASTSCWHGLRSELANYLAKARARVVVQEQHPSSDVKLLESFDQLISRAAEVIYLVGRHPGQPAADHAVASYLATRPGFLKNHPGLRRALERCGFRGIPHTQWEALIALDLGKPLYVYHTADADSNPSQKEHLALLKECAGPWVKTFRTRDELKSKVAQDLMADRNKCFRDREQYLTHENLHLRDREPRLRTTHGPRWVGPVVGVHLLVAVGLLVVAGYLTYQSAQLLTATRQQATDRAVAHRNEADNPQPLPAAAEPKRADGPPAVAPAEAGRTTTGARQPSPLVPDLASVRNSVSVEPTQSGDDRDKLAEIVKAQATSRYVPELSPTPPSRPVVSALGPFSRQPTDKKCVIRYNGAGKITITDDYTRLKPLMEFDGNLGVGTSQLDNGTLESNTEGDGFGVITPSEVPPSGLTVTVMLDGIQLKVTPSSRPVPGKPGYYLHEYKPGRMPNRGKPILGAYVKV